MTHQIVVCMDGAWNDPGGQTNVYRLFQMLPGNEQAVEDSGPIRSHIVKIDAEVTAYYLDGIGKGGRPQGLLGASHGISLHDRMIDAYLLIAQTYQRGDKIWLFGFSRGAWTARTLGAFIARSGLIPAAEAGEEDAADQAERIWLNYKEGRGHKRGGRYWRYHDETPIRMIGVWETVGELGMPTFDGLRLVDREQLAYLNFGDLELSPRVEHGRQALAIDENRADFPPTLWNHREGIKQVWFCGGHADIGGGYEKQGLSDLALEWMVQEINDLDAGLLLSPQRLSQALSGDSLQNRHDETHGPLWRTRPSKARQIPDDAPIHSSVLQRLQQRSDYRPAALATTVACTPYYDEDRGRVMPEEELDAERETPPFRKLPVDGSTHFPAFASRWWNASGVEVDVGERYRIEASGSWTDKSIPAGAEGYESNAWFLHWAESSRRMERRPWFSLVAAIHPRADLETSNPDAENMLTGLLESAIHGVARIDDESQLIATPRTCEIEIVEPGFLYFFANDSAFSYGNNSGFLSIQVTRLPSAEVEPGSPPTVERVPGSLDLKLYFTPDTSSLAVHVALCESGLDFDLVRVDLVRLQLDDGSDFKAINPKGCVPVLEINDGKRLTEIPAILEYIADRVPESCLAPRPYTLERYHLHEWLAFISSEMHKAFLPLFQPETPKEYAEHLRRRLESRLDYLESCLKEPSCLAGEQFTVADAYLFTILGWTERAGIDLSRWSSLMTYRCRVAMRRSIRQAQKAEDCPTQAAGSKIVAGVPE